jgi:sulfide:quinone oxidoreductase
MNIRKLSDEVSVTGQIAAGDVPALAGSGFRSIVCNRPDGESSGQPTAKEIESAAAAAGLAFRYVPVHHGASTSQPAAVFRAVLDELPKPVLAYCRSGARSAMLYAAVTSARQPASNENTGGFSLSRLLSGLSGR